MADILSRIPVDALRVFEAAARRLSFTLAAAELGMSQAAVSCRIRDLEQRLGLAVFARSGRGVRLTVEGERLAAASSEAFSLLRCAALSAMEDNAGVLSITTLHSLAVQWLGPRVGQFQLSNADLAVRIDTSSGLSVLGDGGFDVALRCGRGRWPGLESLYLMPAILTPLCTPALRDRFALRTPADLKHAPLVGEASEWDAWLAAADVATEDKAIAPKLAASSQALEVASALGGHSVALGSPLLYASEIRSGLLVQPFPQIVPLTEGFWLCYPAKNRCRAKIARFRDWVLAQASADPDVVAATERAGRTLGEPPD